MPTLGPVRVHRADVTRSQPTGVLDDRGRPVFDNLPYATDVPVYLDAVAPDVETYGGTRCNQIKFGSEDSLCRMQIWRLMTG